MKINVCSIGEAMIEISNIKNSFYNQSFAGDTLNFCNYLDKKKLNAFFLSAIGKSEINQSLLNFVKSKKISTKYIKKINQFEVGLYLIKNKDNGEKQFFYWRDESAAKQYFNNIDFLNLYKELKNFDYIYFSGITLSIIHISKLNNFIKLLRLLKSNKRLNTVYSEKTPNLHTYFSIKLGMFLRINYLKQWLILRVLAMDLMLLIYLILL